MIDWGFVAKEKERDRIVGNALRCFRHNMIVYIRLFSNSINRTQKALCLVPRIVESHLFLLTKIFLLQWTCSAQCGLSLTQYERWWSLLWPETPDAKRFNCFFCLKLRVVLLCLFRFQMVSPFFFFFLIFF